MSKHSVALEQLGETPVVGILHSCTGVSSPKVGGYRCWQGKLHLAKQ